MLSDIEAHMKGLIAEIDIHNDNPEHIAINITITDKIQTLAISEKRVYTSTPIKGDEGDVIFMSIPRDQFTESFYELEEQ